MREKSFLSRVLQWAHVGISGMLATLLERYTSILARACQYSSQLCLLIQNEKQKQKGRNATGMSPLLLLLFYEIIDVENYLICFTDKVILIIKIKHFFGIIFYKVYFINEKSHRKIFIDSFQKVNTNLEVFLTLESIIIITIIIIITTSKHTP